jgi:hypothetical protein
VTNKSHNIAVVGGTRFDSRKGAQLLKNRGIEASAINMSETPQEQLDLYSDPLAVYHRFQEKCIGKGFSEFVFYCNSLSFSYPWENHAEYTIHELTAYYADILGDLKEEASVVVVAEEATRQNLIKFVQNGNLKAPQSLRIDARLDLIDELEAADENEQKALMSEMIEGYRREGMREVVLGCTHFDDPNLKSTSSLKIYQPGLQLIESVVKQHA